MTKSVLISTLAANLRDRLTASFEGAAYAIQVAATQDEAIAALRNQPADALVVEAERHAFALMMRSAFRLNPAMPIHLINGNAVFCFYPLWRQPPDLIEAIRGAGVSIPERLLNGVPPSGPAQVMAADAVLI